MLRISAAMEQGNQVRLLAIDPEFAEHLRSVQIEGRTERVFVPLGGGGTPRHFGERGRTRFACAHDLRRSFGERWSTRVMPQVLRELMRHESIDTTMRCYVGRIAQNSASKVGHFAEAFRQAGLQR